MPYLDQLNHLLQHPSNHALNFNRGRSGCERHPPFCWTKTLMRLIMLRVPGCLALEHQNHEDGRRGLHPPETQNTPITLTLNDLVRGQIIYTLEHRKYAKDFKRRYVPHASLCLDTHTQLKSLLSQRDKLVRYLSPMGHLWIPKSTLNRSTKK